ncbi:transcription-repair coupling factor [bacterium]|nr:MAG: transcription-repair coupling factor [bacterium]
MGADKLIELLESLDGKGRRIRAQGLRSSSRAYLLARVVGKLKKPILVLTATVPEAKAFADELKFFLGADSEKHPLPWDPPVVYLPPWDTLTFENLPPHPEISAQRIAALFRATNGGPFILVAPVESVLQRLPAPRTVENGSIPISVGEEFSRERFLLKLAQSGYQRVGQVEERGEVSVRGGLVDLFAPHYERPLRLEFFGDDLESIRTFDPSTQRSLDKIEEAVILPAREVVASEEAAEAAFTTLRLRCHKLGMNRSETAEALEAFKTDPFGPHREPFLPYFGDTATLWDYIPESAAVAVDMPGDFAEKVAEFSREIGEGSQRAEKSGRLFPALEESYISPEEWNAHLGSRQVIELESLDMEVPGAVSFDTRDNSDLVTALRNNRGTERLLTPLVDEIKKAKDRGHHTCIVARTAPMALKLREFLREYSITVEPEKSFTLSTPENRASVSLCIGGLARGFRFPGEKLTLITQAEIFGMKGKRPPPRRGLTRTSLAELKDNDLIVHADFGIGRYRGMARIAVEGIEGDYLHLEYADGDKLYLPVTRLAIIQRYTAPGGGENVSLDKIGGKRWEKACKKAREGIEEMAHELLDLYAKRTLAERPPYNVPDLAYREFAATFPYEETRDQFAAIDDVLGDMTGKRPMDRLICGDVGYGKTEVAIRAAFQSVHGGKQVAVLTPTTVLAAQHFQNFKKRFEGYPITVEMLSRFVSKEEQDAVSRRLAEGKTDIVVGTHRLIQSDVKFKNLGLVVIDEEHRFGVAQKEKLKKMRGEVDMLCLSATPIPRTLQMSFTGIRDLSVIETPPADRLSVRTKVARFDDDVIKEAIKRELGRGGQVYFVHNRVQSIEEVAHHLRELFPGVRFAVGHGQMKENSLQEVMEQFTTGEVQVLVCTAIIESGLDIPRANTILINRADLFGLADLYQLRGRVGRSNVQAYCYLLLPAEEQGVTADAQKRLQAMQQYSDLGAGFKVALHDLEIRGAGELLGKNQSGQIAAIGFDLYAELLEEAVHRLKGEPYRKAPEPEIRLRVPAHFPEAYVPDPRQRLALYERLARIEAEEEAEDLRYEFIDRFGPLPKPVENLLEVMKLRHHLIMLRILALDYTGEELVLSFGEDPGVDTARIVELAGKEPNLFRLTPDSRLKWKIGKGREAGEIFSLARELLDRLR